MTSLAELWERAGRPEPNWTGKAKTLRAAPPTRDGICALTGVVGLVVDIRHVLSDLFTEWDRLPHRNHPLAGISIPAAWAFRLRVAMQWPHVCIGDGPLTQVDPEGLRDALVALPTHPQGIVCVPQSMQKHLLPFATPGTVRTDAETLTWTVADVERLRAVETLRGLGFGEAALAEPAPRWPTMSRLDPQARSTVLGLWRDLAPWRTHGAYLDVACRATRKPKEPAA